MLETIRKLFTPVKSLDADGARAFVESHKAGSFTLLDVRQHRGTSLPTFRELLLSRSLNCPTHTKDLDPDKPTIVY